MLLECVTEVTEEVGHDTTFPTAAKFAPFVVFPWADLTLIRARAGLVRARTALVNTVRGLAKSYGERLRSCNVRNLDPEKADGLSPELQAALEPLLRTTTSPGAAITWDGVSAQRA